MQEKAVAVPLAVQPTEVSVVGSVASGASDVAGGGVGQRLTAAAGRGRATNHIANKCRSIASPS